MQTQRTLLVVAAGFRPQLILTAREMGFRVALLDESPPADPKLYDDFLAASPTDEGPALQAVADYVATGHTIDAVACFFDGSIHVAAAICEEYGVLGNSRDAVRNMRDKYRSWQVLSAAGLPVPRTEIADSEDEAVAAAENIGYPLVVKPQASAASQGVMKVTGKEQLIEAFRTINGMYEATTFGEGAAAVPNIGQLLYYPDARRVLLQEYLDGFEICVDLVYNEDQYRLLGILDKPQVWPEPYFPELIFVTPSSLPLETQHQVKDLCLQALRAIGVTAGAAHIEFRITTSGPKIIEVNGRIGGPSLFVQEIMQLSSGVWGPREYISAVSGEVLKENNGYTSGRPTGFTSLPIESYGRILRFEGVDEVRNLPGVVDIRWVMRPGQYVTEGYPRNPSVMFAHVLATGETYDGVVETLEQVRGKLKAVMEA